MGRGYRFGERFGRAFAYDEVDAIFGSVTSPCSQESGDGVGESVFKCRDNNTASGTGHALHRLPYIGGCD